MGHVRPYAKLTMQMYPGNTSFVNLAVEEVEDFW